MRARLGAWRCQTRWQATSRSPTCLSSGIASVQIFLAMGQRVEKGQPGGGFMGEGISP